MEEVKKEIFGSRNSILEEQFITNEIAFIKNIWFVTCRYKINSNKLSRYLVLIENDQEIDTSIFKSSIPIYRIKFEQSKITLLNLSNKEQLILNSKESLKDWIIEITKCRYVKSFAFGSESSTQLSRFFRENMGKGFSLTDVDFFLINKQILIEEKGYINNDKGYLGVGQCLSFKEIMNDICKGIQFHIILINGNDFYGANLSKIDCNNRRILPQWGGEMVEFKLSRRLSIEEVISLYK